MKIIPILWAVFAFAITFFVCDIVLREARFVRPDDVVKYRFGLPMVVSAIVWVNAQINANRKK